MQRVEQTLTILQKENKLLLGLKKHGFGEGRWNGFGGKVKENECVRTAAIREMQEEAGVKIKDPQLTGIMEFYFSGKDEFYQVYVFRASKYSGEPKESEEMKPQWFTTDKIPYEEMWVDDKHWLPLFLRGKDFYSQFHFIDQTSLYTYELREMNWARMNLALNKKSL
ncbi:MAG: 8-oxo-dGTP diphosphatase [bacterium]